MTYISGVNASDIDQLEHIESLLKDAYYRYIDTHKAKHIKKPGPSVQIKMRGNLVARIDKALISLGSGKSTAGEKDRYISKSKVIIREYATNLKNETGVINDFLVKKLDKLIETMVKREAERFLVHKSKITKHRIDYEKLFYAKGAVNVLVGQGVEQVLDRCFVLDSMLYQVMESDITYYVTPKGGKYHVQSCSYCQGKQLETKTWSYIMDRGMQPCGCVNKFHQAKDDGAIIQTVEEKTTAEVTNFDSSNVKPEACCTVFIDESVRNNILHRYNEDLEDKHGVYSYIICKGRLESELQITTKNILGQGVGLITEDSDVVKTSTEAIGAVLLKLVYEFNFKGNVYIFTDNAVAKKKWNQNKGNKRLSKLFDNVYVKWVSRENNTKADKLGRDVAFVTGESVHIRQLENTCRAYDVLQKNYEALQNKYNKLTEEYDFVRTYFDNPRKQLPNLVEELELLAKKKGGM